jgi:hypothetical protein
MRTNEPPAKKGRDVFWRGQARTDADKLKLHEQSKLHLEAVATAKDTVYSKLIESFTVQLSSMKAGVLHKMYDAYFIAKENVSLMKHRSFTFLSRLHGVPSSLKYANKDMCREYIECISAVLLNRQLDRIKASPVFGIAIDESTDISLEKHCVVYVKYVYNAVVRVEFLACLLIIGAATAENVMQTVVQYLEGLELDLNLWLTFGSDGASVMLGKDMGVVARLKRAVNPMMVAVHCICHRMMLGCVDAGNKIKYAERWEKLVNHIYSHFSRSGDRTAEWKRIHLQVCGRWTKLAHSCKTRWLSRHGAVESIRKNLRSLVMYFATVSAPAIRNNEGEDDVVKRANLGAILTAIKTCQFAVAMHFFADILGAFAVLNKDWQRDILHVHEVVATVADLKAQLRLAYSSNPEVSDPEQAASWDLRDICEYGGTYF